MAIDDQEVGRRAGEDARQATLDALEKEAKERGADSYLNYVVKKFYDLSGAKKVLTASYQGDIISEETDYDDARTQLEATRELARMGEAMYAPKEISGPGGGPVSHLIQLSDEDRKLIGDLKEKIKDAILTEHLESIKPGD